MKFPGRICKKKKIVLLLVFIYINFVVIIEQHYKYPLIKYQVSNITSKYVVVVVVVVVS